MNLRFEKQNKQLVLAIVYLVISLAVIIVMAVFEHYIFIGMSALFLPLAGVVLLSIDKSSSFKGDKTHDYLSFAGFLVYFLTAAISMNSSTAFIGTISSYLTIDKGMVNLIIVLNSVFSIICNLFWIMTIVAFFVYAFSNKEKADALKITKIGIYGLIVSVIVLATLTLIAFFLPYSNYPLGANYRVFGYVAGQVISAFICLFYINNMKYVKMVKVSSGNQSSYTPSNKSSSSSLEKDKIETILKYKELLDNGVITREEFEAKKKEILG